MKELNLLIRGEVYYGGSIMKLKIFIIMCILSLPGLPYIFKLGSDYDMTSIIISATLIVIIYKVPGTEKLREVFNLNTKFNFTKIVSYRIIELIFAIYWAFMIGLDIYANDIAMWIVIVIFVAVYYRFIMYDILKEKNND